MTAQALLLVERDPHGGSVVRELRSASPVTLVSDHGPAADGTALVHLAGSPTGPVGDDLVLAVRVGEGARLVLRGVAATLALPAHRPGGSRAQVRIEVAAGASVQYLPEPTVVASPAHQEAELSVDLAEGARLRAREVLVLGGGGEHAGRVTSTVRVRRGGRPALHQQLRIGRPELHASPAYLAGRKAIGTEVLFWGEDPPVVSEQWWSLVPLAMGGALATALADDAVTAQRWLDEALEAHPGFPAG